MMNLDTQIKTFLFSVLFGLIFSFIIDILHKALFKLKPLLQVIISFILVISSSLIYFIILLKLNNAIIHPYYIIAFITGFLLEIALKKAFKTIVLFLKK